MVKLSYDWTEEKIKRFYNEGRGSGEGKNYKPWLTVQDCPSDDRAARLKGWKTGRVHEMLNDRQTRLLYFTDWAEDVTDIREHFPLDREITLNIAQKLGKKHPTQSGIPIVITTDFLITSIRDNQVVNKPYAVVKKAVMELPKTINKFEIEQEYWKSKQAELIVATENELSGPFTWNLEWVHEYYYLEELSNFKKDDLEELIIIFLERIRRSGQSLQKIMIGLEKDLNLEEGTFLYLVRHLIARKVLKLDMNQRIHPSKILAKDIIVNPYKSFIKEQLA